MRIGIVVDDPKSFPGYIAELVEKLSEQNSSTSGIGEIIIIAMRRKGVEPNRTRDTVFEAIIKIEQRLFPNPFKSSAIRVKIPENRYTVIQMSASDGKSNLAKEFKNLNLDYLVDVGHPFNADRAVQGECSKPGILRIVSSQSRQTANFPFTFPGVLAGKSTTQVSLQLVSQSLPQPVEVETAQVATEFSWTRNRDKALATVPDLIMRFLKRQLVREFQSENGDLEYEGFESIFDSRQTDNSTASPKFFNQMKYVSKLIGAAINRKVIRPMAIKLRALIGKYEPGYWTVRFGKLNDDPATWATIRLDPKVRWAADPFLLRHRGSRFLLFEDWDVGSKIGTISAVNINSPDEIFPVLQEPFHLSYPYTFFRNDAWYMIPESNQSGAVKLYSLEFDEENIEFRAVFIRNLLDGKFVDPTVVRVGQRDFLFLNPLKTYSQHFNEALDVFISDDITNENAILVPHPMNPVEIDPVISRNAGRASLCNSQHDGMATVKRYSQKCDRVYGEDLVENVISLDEASYRRISATVLHKNSIGKRVHNFDFDDEFGTLDFYFEHGFMR